MLRVIHYETGVPLIMKSWLSGVTSVALIAASLSMGAVRADGPVSSRLEALKVTADASGQESFVAAGEVAPGDLIEYRLTYANSGKTAVSQLAVNGPVPKGTTYVPGSASTTVRHELKFSYDNGQTWLSTPPVREVRAADGKTQQRPAGPEEITNVEWQVREPLKVGSTQAYRYRVKVLAVPG